MLFLAEVSRFAYDFDIYCAIIVIIIIIIGQPSGYDLGVSVWINARLTHPAVEPANHKQYLITSKQLLKWTFQTFKMKCALE